MKPADILTLNLLILQRIKNKFFFFCGFWNNIFQVETFFWLSCLIPAKNIMVINLVTCKFEWRRAHLCDLSVFDTSRVIQSKIYYHNTKHYVFWNTYLVIDDIKYCCDLWYLIVYVCCIFLGCVNGKIEIILGINNYAITIWISKFNTMNKKLTVKRKRKPNKY